MGEGGKEFYGHYFIYNRVYIYWGTAPISNFARGQLAPCPLLAPPLVLSNSYCVYTAVATGVSGNVIL